MTAYYNEIDPKAAAWLRELIKQGHIAPGVVDERSILDVRPNDLTGFTQVHFFAGIGVWSYALRQAGWPDDRPAWTGSCPCQPFSSAGKGRGFDDERHLWPAMHWLIEQCRPVTVFGEQVASKDGLSWFDLVQTDLEGAGYTCGALDLCSAGFGGAHIRQRLYWVAQSASDRCARGRQTGEAQGRPATGWDDKAEGTHVSRQFSARSERPSSELPIGVAHSEREQRKERLPRPGKSIETQGSRETIESTRLCMPIGMAYTNKHTRLQRLELESNGRSENTKQNGVGGVIDGNTLPTHLGGRPVDWLFCRDNKWRPVEPGTSPLVNESAARVVRLRGYGNAIDAKVAAAFIEVTL